MMAPDEPRIVQPAELDRDEADPGRLELLRSRVYTLDQLTTLPPVSWLVPGMLPARGLGFLYGASGHGKSFVAVDLGLSLASGIPYAGRPVARRYRVLYVLAEGSAGFYKRTAAWRLHNPHGDPGDRFLTLPEPVNLGDPNGVDSGYLAEIAAEHLADLVIVDTLARAMTGADENSARDMGVFVANAEAVARRIGGLLLPVHHTGKDETKGMRGSSAAFGGADVVIGCTKSNDEVVLRNTKMKDDAEFDPVRFVMKPAGESVALEYQDGLYLPPVKSEVLLELVRLIHDRDDGTGVPGGVVEDAYAERTGRGRSDYFATKKQAMARGLIRNMGPDSRPRFTVTPAGLLDLGTDDDFLGGLR